MGLLTRQEGLQFVQTILNIPLSDVPEFSDKSLPLSAKLSFLEILFQSFLENELFQSISLMSHDISQRRTPTWEEVKQDLMLGRGGVCYWLNVFMYGLLSSLGLETYVTFATTDCVPSKNNHLVVLIQELTPGSLHLVDVGVGLYIPRAIPLDFQLESAEYKESFATYKLVRGPDGIMHFMIKDGQAAAIPTAQQTPCEDTILISWNENYIFNPSVVIRDLELLSPDFDVNFSDPTKLAVNSSPRAMCWRNGRFIALVNLKLIEEVEDGKLKKTILLENQTVENVVNFKPTNKRNYSAGNVKEGLPHQTNDRVDANGKMTETVKQEHDNVQPDLSDLEPLVQAYGKYFPQLTRDLVEAALKNWMKTGTLHALPM